MIEELNRKIEIKDSYMSLIYNIICDYDGCHTVESLKELIDEASGMLIKALNCDDKSVMYIGANNIKENILMEEII